jgi:hypothetical protein
MLAKVPQEDEAHSPYLYAKELGHPVYLVKVEVGALLQMM